MTQYVPASSWHPTNGHRLHIALMREDEGFSALVLNLPGDASQGDTEEEALNNVKEATLGVIASYEEAGEQVPWKTTSSADVPNGAKEKWLVLQIDPAA